MKEDDGYRVRVRVRVRVRIRVRVRVRVKVKVRVRDDLETCCFSFSKDRERQRDKRTTNASTITNIHHEYTPGKHKRENNKASSRPSQDTHETNRRAKSRNSQRT